MTLYDFVALLLSIWAVLYCAVPLFGRSSEKQTYSKGSQRTEDAKGRCLQMLEDLELEFALGNMQEDDFKSSKRRIEKELAQYL